MRRPLLAAAAAVVLAGAPAASAKTYTVEAALHRVPKFELQYKAAYEKAAGAIGDQAVGRNIVTDGWRDERTGNVRLARRAEVVDATRRLVVAVAPQPVTYTSTTPSAASYSGAGSSTLDAIAACESGGDPTAVSPDGSYRGKYQFDYGTWASVGGSGDPAAASEAEQDMRAAMLYAQSGPAPWPICGQ